MRKLAAAVALLSLVAVSCETHRTKADRLVENYAVVKIPAPDLSGITDNGKEVLNLYRFAADEVDKIYWKQNYGEKDAFLASGFPSAAWSIWTICARVTVPSGANRPFPKPVMSPWSET